MMLRGNILVKYEPVNLFVKNVVYHMINQHITHWAMTAPYGSQYLEIIERKCFF